MILRWGPFVAPLELVIYAAIFISALLAACASVPRERRAAASSLLIDALLAGVIAARLVFVLQYLDQYSSDWLSSIDIRDGGFNVLAGVAVALLWVSITSWRIKALRKPTLTALFVCCLGAGSVAFVKGAITPQLTPLPATDLVRLDDRRHINLAENAPTAPRVINLWASWCPPCRKEMPLLVNAAARHHDIHFQLINQGEAASKVRAYLDKEHLSSRHILLDAYSQLSQQFSNGALPATLFVDAQGNIINIHTGMLSQATLMHYLDALIPTSNASSS